MQLSNCLLWYICCLRFLMMFSLCIATASLFWTPFEQFRLIMEPKLSQFVTISNSLLLIVIFPWHVVCLCTLCLSSFLITRKDFNPHCFFLFFFLPESINCSNLLVLSFFYTCHIFFGSYSIVVASMHAYLPIRWSWVKFCIVTEYALGVLGKQC